MDEDNPSASAARRSFTTAASSRLEDSSAKCCLRCRVYVVRAEENRCHSSSSLDLSSRGRAFHSSRSSRSRVTPCRQSVPHGDRLGLGGDLGLGVAGFLDLGGAFGLALLALLRDQWGEGLQPGPQAVQVADGLGLVDRAGHLLHRGASVVGGHGARLHALLQQVHLEGESVVPAGVEGEGLLRVGIRPLTDRSFAVLGPYEDRSVLCYPAPAFLGHNSPLPAVCTALVPILVSPRFNRVNRAIPGASGAVPTRITEQSQTPSRYATGLRSQSVERAAIRFDLGTA